MCSTYIRAAFILCLLEYTTIAAQWSAGNILRPGISAGVEFTESMAVGQRLAHQNCRKQFLWHRWNCPANYFIGRTRRPHSSTREAAVVDALTAGSVAFSLTRNCSSGQVAGCSCHRRSGPGGPGWQWGGCSDNIEFGERMSQQLLDMIPLDLSPRDTLVRLHNNQAGRQLVRRSARRRCKCHGVSGSCSTETCWKQIEDFSLTAERMRRKYQKAIRMKKLSRRNAMSQSAMLDINRVALTDLVYVDPSPDYCQPDNRLGIAGSRGRECSRRKDSASRPERRSCRTLCRACGHAVKRSRVIVQSSCRCKFHWCCHVTCDTCHNTVVKYECV